MTGRQGSPPLAQWPTWSPELAGRGLIRLWLCSTSGWGLWGETYHPDVCRRQGRGRRGGVIAGMGASGSGSGFARYLLTG